MEQLFKSLTHIIELLDQIYTITINQRTILLDSKNAGDGLDMIEEMATYKNELTNKLEAIEGAFQEQYAAEKENLTDIEVQKLLKQAVGQVLELKDKVIQLEQHNVLIMQDLLRRLNEKIEIPKAPGAVVHAYKQYSKR